MGGVIDAARDSKYYNAISKVSVQLIGQRKLNTPMHCRRHLVWDRAGAGARGLHVFGRPSGHARLPGEPFSWPTPSEEARARLWL